MMRNNNIPFKPSPHFSHRPNHADIDMIVLHAISLPDGDFETKHIENFFLGQLDTAAHPEFKTLENIKVSAHFVVARNGAITQFVSIDKRAWHAGKSTWLGRDNCNDYSIGIEIVGDERQPFTQRQYTETARLCRALFLYYPHIHKERIVGHQDIAPGRKWDPGKQWDWSRFFRSFHRIRRLDTIFKP